MIMHVQSLYNSLEEAKCWAKAFIKEDLNIIAFAAWNKCFKQL